MTPIKTHLGHEKYYMFHKHGSNYVKSHVKSILQIS
jgi:hypothetical protein